jgi:hypothetical protein
VYDVQRDPNLKDKSVIRDKKKFVFPFVSGSTYKGEWKDDVKDGFGTMISPDGTIYEGDWRNNAKHGRGTLWRKRGKQSAKEYVGEWQEDMMHGDGIFYYENGDVYNGEFIRGEKCGRGKIQFADGSKYDGEFSNDTRCGYGIYFSATGDVHEGYWLNDLKEGPGKYTYLTTRKVYEGEWVAGQPKCGEYRSATEQELEIFSTSQALRKLATARDESFPLPELGLEKPLSLLQDSIEQIRQERDVKFGLNILNGNT